MIVNRMEVKKVFKILDKAGWKKEYVQIEPMTGSRWLRIYLANNSQPRKKIIIGINPKFTYYGTQNGTQPELGIYGYNKIRQFIKGE